ncbi:MAG: DUF3788 domain-containing protein [Lachnospiraceae bacterium]|nr:DUF3788 domain-containing protein [Lachnospiraceae bacterium]
MKWSVLFTNETPPSLKQVAKYIDNPLWIEFNARIQSAYQVKPHMEYSRCLMQAGWNIKYRKGGKSLCTLYPAQGYFIALVVIGNQEFAEAESSMPQCSAYVQEVFRNTKTGNGQKWLMLEVRDKQILSDVFYLISLRKRTVS